MAFLKKNFLMLVGILLALIGVVFLSTPVAMLDGDQSLSTLVVGLLSLFVEDGKITVTGFELIFGLSNTTKILGAEVTTELLSLSIVGLLSLIVLVVAILFAFVSPRKKIASAISAVLFIVTAVMFYLLPTFATFAENFKDVGLKLVVEPCLYVAAGLELLAGIVVLMTMFISSGKKKKRK